MRARSAASVLAAVLAALALAACAAPGTRPAGGPPHTEAPASPQASAAAVPDVTGEDLAVARNLLSRVQLVPIVRYAPEILVNAGSVMLSVPKAGAGASAGDVVVLVVAGRPDAAFDGTPGAKALADLAAAREEVFVGVGFPGADPRKPLTVAFAPGVDTEVWRDRLVAAAGDQRYTVRQCEHSLAELQQVQADLMAGGPRDTPISAAVRPAECAVHVTGAMSDEEAKRLRDRYGTAVALQTGR